MNSEPIEMPHFDALPDTFFRSTRHTIQEWCHIAFNNACVKGFHTGPDGNPVNHKDPIRIGSRIALIHSELSEVLECITRGKEDLHYDPNGKPEGLGVELADVMIRTFDLAESLGLTLVEPTKVPITVLNSKPDTKASIVTNLHFILSTVGTVLCSESLQVFVDSTFTFAENQGVDLWAMIELKHEYNTSRPLRHGGKLL